MSESALKEKNMEYKYLGKSGIKVSNICLGTMTFGRIRAPPANSCDEDLSHQIMDRYVELGGNFLDTADRYNEGISEQIIGRWLEKRERDNIVLATKVGVNVGTERNVNNIGLSRRHITASIDNSLKRLHTDYIDLYQTHCWDEATCTEETLRTLDDLVRCGKVRYVGASNVKGWQMQKVVETCKSMGLNPFVSLQFSTTYPFCIFPLCSGLLSGKFKRNTTPTEGRLAWVADDEETRKGPATPAWSTLDDVTFDIVEAAERIGKGQGKSTAQVALRWLLQKDVVSSVIIGVTKINQLEDNMQASSGWSLSPEEMQELDTLSDRGSDYPYDVISRVNKIRQNPFSTSQRVSNL